MLKYSKRPSQIRKKLSVYIIQPASHVKVSISIKDSFFLFVFHLIIVFDRVFISTMESFYFISYFEYSTPMDLYKNSLFLH